MVPINAKVIYRKSDISSFFKRFFCNAFLFTPKEKYSEKVISLTLQTNINLFMLRNGFLVKKVITDERWVFNFFPAKTQDRKELNVRHGSHCGLFFVFVTQV